MGFPFRGPAPASDDQVGILGVLHDWVARLNAGLKAPVAGVGAATESSTGVTQFATAAEVTAGTLSTKAISPLRYAAAYAAARAAVPVPLAAATASTFTVTNGFIAPPLAQPSGRTEWSTSPVGYKAPQAGWYRAHAIARISDGTGVGWNIGLGVQKVGNENTDQNYLTWQTVPSVNGASVSRFVIQATRLFQLVAGDVIQPIMYSDGGSLTLSSGAVLFDVTPEGF